MKRIRKRAPADIDFNAATGAHLLFGSCLLAHVGPGCACGLTGPDGKERLDVARQLWEEHRDELLVEWRRTSYFRDRPSRPRCWAQQLFDEPEDPA